MSAHPGAAFGYQLSRSRGEWRWIAFDPDGNVRAEGRAPTRAAAAACLVRVVAEAQIDPRRDAA